MICVTLHRDAEGLLIGFACKGHAGYAPAGEDVVCAAVSALSITCCNALTSIAGVSPQAEEANGFLAVRLLPGQQCHDAQVILRVFEQGISDIAASYPKHITLTAR